MKPKIRANSHYISSLGALRNAYMVTLFESFGTKDACPHRLVGLVGLYKHMLKKTIVSCLLPKLRFRFHRCNYEDSRKKPTRSGVKTF